MLRFTSSTVVRVIAEHDTLVGDRTDLVRRPQGADSTLFGGWGVKI